MFYQNPDANENQNQATYQLRLEPAEIGRAHV